MKFMVVLGSNKVIKENLKLVNNYYLKNEY